MAYPDSYFPVADFPEANFPGSNFPHEVTVDISITGQPQSVFAPEGRRVVFSITLSSESEGLQWKKNGVVIEGATEDTLVLDPVAFSDTGDYTCEVDTGVDTLVSSVAKLTVIVYASQDSPDQIPLDTVKENALAEAGKQSKQVFPTAKNIPSALLRDPYGK